MTAARVVAVAPGSPASQAGIRPGDELVALNGEAVRDVIDRLRARIRGGIHLVRYDRDGLRVVDADPDFPPIEASNPRQLGVSAMGRLLLAERADPGPAMTGDPELHGLIAEIRDLGYARQVDAVAAGYGCIAVPSRDRAAPPVPAARAPPLPGPAPRILLCLDGDLTVADTQGGTLTLGRGQTAFAPATDGPLTVRGAGTLIQADVP